MIKRRNEFGFSLIEVMIVVAIIAILAAVALPAYQSQTRKAKRADGKVALTQAAQLQERRYTEMGSYSNAIADLGGSASPDGHYTMTVTIPATAGCTSGTRYYCYTITATPNFPDTECTTLTLTHTGVKGATGSNPSSCW